MWSKNFEQCIKCGTFEKKHKAHGLCRLCYRQTPAVKEQEKRYGKEYNQRPLTKKIRKERQGKNIESLRKLWSKRNWYNQAKKGKFLDDQKLCIYCGSEFIRKYHARTFDRRNHCEKENCRYEAIKSSGRKSTHKLNIKERRKVYQQQTKDKEYQKQYKKLPKYKEQAKEYAKNKWKEINSDPAKHEEFLLHRNINVQKIKEKWTQEQWKKYKDYHYSYIREWYSKKKEKENISRKELGLPLIGKKKFVQQKKLYLYVSNLFGKENVKENNREILGNQLELDIYIPFHKLAFEYQGRQHFEYIQLFHHNLKRFLDYQTRDKLKERLCQEKGVTLIKITHKEELSEQLILQKLNEHNITIPLQVIMVET